MCCGRTTVPRARPSAPDARLAEGDHHDEEWPAVHLHVHRRCRDQVDERKDRQPRHHALQPAEDDLLHRHEPVGNRRQHAVLDLAGGAELHRERKGHRRDSLEHHRHGDEPGHEDRGEVGSVGAAALHPLTDLGKHVREDEHRQERVHHRPRDERREVADEHSRIAQHQPAEGAGILAFRLSHGAPCR